MDRDRRGAPAEELLARLQAISLELATAMSIDDVAATVLDALEAPVAAPSRSLWLRPPGDNVLHLVGHRGMSGSVAEQFARIDIAADLPGAIAARELRTIVSKGRDDAVARFAVLRDVPRTTNGFVAIPLIADQTCVGVLGVGVDTELHGSDLGFLEAVAAQVGQTITRVRLTERDRRRRVELEFLANLTETALAATDHRDLMERVCAAAVPTLGDWCAMYFVPESGTVPEVVSASVDPTRAEIVELLATRFPYDPERPIGVPAVIRTGITHFVPDLTEQIFDTAVSTLGIDPVEAKALVDQVGVKSAITVALRTRRRVVGAMQFVHTASDRHYDHDDLALAEAVAGRLAEALDAAWLAERQARIAVTLQQALLPPTLPDIPGIEIASRYWPAGASPVGGDFYDVFALDDGRWALVIGDACGTGPDAAALTSIARHTVRAAARHGVAPDEVLRWLNDAVLAAHHDLFCTACYVTLAPTEDGWQLTSTAAGHPLPIVASPAGSSTVGRPGTLLGMFEQIETATTTAELRAGDVLVLYTDGMTDLPPPFGITPAELNVLVGEARSQHSADQLADALHRSLLERVPDRSRQDDVALLIARVR